jgi:hypothetical protein
MVLLKRMFMLLLVALIFCYFNFGITLFSLLSLSLSFLFFLFFLSFVTKGHLVFFDDFLRWYRSAAAAVRAEKNNAGSGGGTSSAIAVEAANSAAAAAAAVGVGVELAFPLTSESGSTMRACRAQKAKWQNANTRQGTLAQDRLEAIKRREFREHVRRQFGAANSPSELPESEHFKDPPADATAESAGAGGGGVDQ